MPTKTRAKARDFASSYMERLMAAQADLAERIRAEQLKERNRVKLVRFIARHGFTRKDVLAVAAGMVAKRGTEAVVSNKAHLASGNANNMHPAVGKVGKAIREARLKAGLSTTDLAARAKTGSGAISVYERGLSHPGPGVRARLAKALKIPVGRLVNGDARPTG